MADSASTTVADELSTALSLLRRLVASQMRTLQVARQLMRAQDLAERHRSRAGPAVDEAAASDGDPDAIERAVRAVGLANAAAENEWTISKEWASHVLEVQALADLADELIAQARIVCR